MDGVQEVNNCTEFDVSTVVVMKIYFDPEDGWDMFLRNVG
jgi:hypothetical protein